MEEGLRRQIRFKFGAAALELGGGRAGGAGAGGASDDDDDSAAAIDEDAFFDRMRAWQVRARAPRRAG
jgi:hypothetical protein